MARIEVAGDVCLRRPRHTQGCKPMMMIFSDRLGPSGEQFLIVIVLLIFMA